MSTEVTALASFRSVTYDLYANFPTSPAVEDLAYATDRRALYRWNGAAWEHMSQYHFYGIAADKPTAADLPGGSTYFETDTKKLQQVQSGVWEVVTALGAVSSIYVSDTLRNSNNALKETLSTSYVKVKEMLLNADLIACRIKFDLCVSTTLREAFGRIYKNGVAIGTQQSTSSDTFITYSQDFAGFVAGDLIQIYSKLSEELETNKARVQNMRFYYESQIMTLADETLVTPLPTTFDPTISVTNQDP